MNKVWKSEAEIRAYYESKIKAVDTRVKKWGFIYNLTERPAYNVYERRIETLESPLNTYEQDTR